MGASKLITKEARAYIIEEIHQRGQMSKSEIAELVRPHCSFDPVALQNQAVNRLVGNICRSIRDDHGTRTVFIAKGQDAVVDVETSTSLALVTVIDDQLQAHIKGLQASKEKTARRKQELAGQLDLLGEDLGYAAAR